MILKFRKSRNNYFAYCFLIQGHNNVIVFSRAAYFCILASLILLIDKAIKMNPSSPTLYGVHVYSKHTLEFAKDALLST